MGVVAELADDVAVMYMGNIIEAGTVEDVLRRPIHPYTRALLASMPVLGRGRNQVIEAIPGSTPDPLNRPSGCQFAPRCPYKIDACDAMPEETHPTPSHRVMCWRYEEFAANVA
jgi:peptide/nickel transport system ATP-binding protein